MPNAISGSDVVVAIIGGTLLGLALTRPKFAWLERLDDYWRQYVEVITTIVAFVMGGYAYGALFIVLHRHLEGDIDKLLRVAGAFFAAYALCVHFGPFSNAHNRRELGSAILLYLAVAIAATLGGVVLVEYTLSHSVSSWPTLIKTSLLLLAALILYFLVRRGKPEVPGTATSDDTSATG